MMEYHASFFYFTKAYYDHLVSQVGVYSEEIELFCGGKIEWLFALEGKQAAFLFDAVQLLCMLGA